MHKREIFYSTHDGSFMEFDGRIDNIYKEILPCYVYLLRTYEKDLVIKDLGGRLTEITVLPF